MASRKLVLPWPLSPASTLKRACGSTSTASALRKAESSTASSFTRVSGQVVEQETRTARTQQGARVCAVRGDSDSHRHHHAEVVLAVDGADHAGIELAV